MIAHIGPCNFTARIAEHIVRVDGQRQSHAYRVVGQVCGGSAFDLLVAVEDFEDMAWARTIPPGGEAGIAARLEAGPRIRQHAVAAIDALSDNRITRTICTHTGWRETESGWRFNHAGGSIGGDGNDPETIVELLGRLQHYRSPDPPEADGLRLAVIAVLGILKLANDARPHSEAIAAVCVCLAFRAVLGNARGNLWIEGKTGAFKTELVANVLMRFFFGEGFGREAVPMSWESTQNALEIQAFLAKDTLGLVDDYRPPEDPRDRRQYVSRADRVLRNAVNRQGRDRATVDGGLQESKFPRCLIVVTAETGPPEGSGVPRTLVLPVVAEDRTNGVVGTLDPDVLAGLSRAAADGLFARAMAGFLRWLAPRYDEVRRGLGEDVERRARALREELAGAGLHARTPEIAVDLQVGFGWFMRFAVEVNAVSAEDAKRLVEQVERGLRSAAIDQAGHQDDADPICQFIDALRGGLAAGKGYLGDHAAGGPPEGCQAACGWRRPPGADPHNWEPPTRSERGIGWVNLHQEKIWLLPDAAVNLAERAISGGLQLRPKTLGKRLREANLLVAAEKGTTTVKRKAEGSEFRVWELPLPLLLPQTSSYKFDVSVLDSDVDV